MYNGDMSEQKPIIDDPEWDGTDYAHPAWWRGNDAGCNATVRRMLDALEGRDDGAGVLGSSEMERARRMILELVRLKRATITSDNHGIVA